MISIAISLIVLVILLSIMVLQFRRNGRAVDRNHALSISLVQDQRDRAETAERQRDEYFALVETVVKERDIWKDMWFSQSHSNQLGQDKLREKLTDREVRLRAAVQTLNKIRKEQNQPELKNMRQLDAAIFQVPEEFAAQRERLSKEMMPSKIDPIALRDEILNRYEQSAQADDSKELPSVEIDLTKAATSP